jgi:polyphosphate kinase 2 (PPK2 family)
MWKAYTIARDDMLKHTSSKIAPWIVISANDKKLAHLNLIADLLSRVDYPEKNKKLLKIDPKIILRWPANTKKLPKLSQ